MSVWCAPGLGSREALCANRGRGCVTGQDHDIEAVTARVTALNTAVSVRQSMCPQTVCRWDSVFTDLTYRHLLRSHCAHARSRTGSMTPTWPVPAGNPSLVGQMDVQPAITQMSF